jgi:cell division protein FtsI (penicillin-binding protein 3)
MLKRHRLRVLIAAGLSLAAFGLIEARLYVLQVRERERFADRARDQQNANRRLYPSRGAIYARNGGLLAASTFYLTAYYEPSRRQADIPPGLTARLARALGVEEATLIRKMKASGRPLIRRKVSPEAAETVADLLAPHAKLRGLIGFESESKREYPQGDLAGPVVGLAGLDTWGDNLGRMGLELHYDTVLRGHKVDRKAPVTVWRSPIAPLDEEAIRSSFGRSIALTLDPERQRATEGALRKRIGDVQAEDGVAIVMDVNTGAILAMASCPGYDPGDLRQVLPEQLKNRAIHEQIEIGSVMKVLTAAIWIDRGLLGPDELIDCHEGEVYLSGPQGRRRIRDSHSLGVVPYRTAFAESSNIAHAELGLRIDKATYHQALRRFGLGEKTGIDLPGEASGLLRPVSKWDWFSMTSLPWGYESQMTALQVVAAIAAIGNGGVRMRPYLVEAILSPDGRTLERTEPREVARVAGSEACRIVRELMEEVVLVGTGKPAAVPGYRVGGKTGTTRKTGPPEFMAERHYIASFGGLFPIDRPQVAIYIYINEPDPKIDYYGGAVAASVFAEIAREAAHHLGIAPSEAFDNSPAAGARIARLGPANSIPNSTASAKDVSIRELQVPFASAMAGGVAEASAEAPVGPPSAIAPSFIGLTVREAIERQAEEGLEELEIRGAGIALRQWPPAGSPLEPGRSVQVFFALPSKRIDSAGGPDSGAWFDGAPAEPSEEAPAAMVPVIGPGGVDGRGGWN